MLKRKEKKMLNEKIYFGGCTFKIVRIIGNEVTILCSSACVLIREIKYNKRDYTSFQEFMECQYGA